MSCFPSFKCLYWVLFLGFLPRVVMGEPEAPSNDRFLQLAQSIAPKIEIYPIIENGHHALEGTLMTSVRPESILESFQKLFHSQNLSCEVHFPEKRNPIGTFVGKIANDEKKLVIMPAMGGNGYLVKIYSFQSGKAFKQKYPTIFENLPELKGFGEEVSFEKESFVANWHFGLIVYFSSLSQKDSFEAVKRRLVQAGWKESVSELLKQEARPSKGLLSSMKKGSAGLMLTVTEEDGEVNMVVMVKMIRERVN